MYNNHFYVQITEPSFYTDMNMPRRYTSYNISVNYLLTIGNYIREYHTYVDLEPLNFFETRSLSVRN